MLDLFLLVDCVRVAGIAADEFEAISLSVPVAVAVSVPIVLSTEHVVLER